MSNSKRWKEFVTWWRDLSTTGMYRQDLEQIIDNKIEQIRRAYPSKEVKNERP